jgi:hypothetical protein
MAIPAPILRGVAALLIAIGLADGALAQEHLAQEHLAQERLAQQLAEDNWLTRMLQPSAAPSVPAPAPTARDARMERGNPARRGIH